MVGQHIGKYHVTRQIGRGGMGIVYGAIDETLRREVAIKVLNTGLDDPTVARRFRAEAITVARLNHPGIAPIYELVQHDGQWLMVMEFVRGETLERVLATQGPLAIDRATDMTMRLLAALAHAHGLGVVHRDLKPANIMLTGGGGLKIMDFGIARVAGAEQLTSVGFMLGTPAYMAPEQVLGGDIDARTDLYAVGILLFQAVSGAMPFNGTTAVQVAQARLNEQPTPLAAARADLPAWLGQIVDRALSRDPGQRFQTALLFREALRRGREGLPVFTSEADDFAGPMTAAAGELPIVVSDRPAAAAVVIPPVPASATAEAPRLAAAALPEPAEPPVVVASAPPRRSPLLLGGLAAVVLMVGAAAWLLTRPSTAGAVVAPEVTAADSALAAPAPSGAGDLPAQASAPIEPAPAAAAASVSRPSAPTAAEPPAAGRSSVAAARPPGGAGAAPPARPAPAAPVMFRGVRGLLVAGNRAQERPAVLAFADAAVTLLDDGGKTPLVVLPYRRITSAAHTHDRDPRWYPTLAGPPVDVDMPGGLFRGKRHWLALQSRDAWMIVRMNDGDWQQITAAVTSHLGLKVEELRP